MANIPAGQESTNTGEQLANQEKRAAKRMTLGGFQYGLIFAIVTWIGYLFLPHATGVPGYAVTFMLPQAKEADITIVETVYAVLLAVSIGILTTLTVLTRRAVFGLCAWPLVTIALFFSVLSMWLRMTRPQNDDVSLGVGIFLSIAGAVVAFLCYCMVALRRDPEQKAIAEERARTTDLDSVAKAQRELLNQERSSVEENPLLIDDRRQLAAERHRQAGYTQD